MTKQDRAYKILKELKTALKDIYQDRLKELILFGSYARGEGTSDSDIDVAVVLSREVDQCKEIDRMMNVIDEISLKYDELISVYPVSLKKFKEINSPLIMNIRREGITL